MRLAWTRRALNDRKAIQEYIRQHSPRAALDLDDLLVSSARSLLATPAIGRQGRMQGTRELVAHRHYILIYKIVADEVRVLRILHASRRWPPCKA